MNSYTFLRCQRELQMQLCVHRITHYIELQMSKIANIDNDLWLQKLCLKIKKVDVKIDNIIATNLHGLKMVLKI